MSKLNPKQDIFCREYLIDFNAAQAAVRAGYSKKTAQPTASRMLSNVMVQSRLNELISARAERVQREADEVLKRLWEVADLKVVEDAGELINGEFKVSDSAAWSEATKRVIRSVKSTRTIRRGREEVEETISSLKAPEVMSALVELMKHHGLTNDFNQAITCLKKYGLWLLQNKDGQWQLEDRNQQGV
jgi:phage terminase small subunit